MSLRWSRRFGLGLLLGVMLAQAGAAWADQLAELRARLATPDGQAILQKLGDPAVRAALVAPVPAAPGSAAFDGSAAAPQAALLDSGNLAAAMTRLRIRLLLYAAWLPALPAAIAAGIATLRAGLPADGGLHIAVGVVALVAGGLVLQHGFWRASRRWREHIRTAAFDDAMSRLRVTFERLVLGVAVLAFFLAGSLGGYLLLSWPPLVGKVVLDLLLAFAVVRAVMLTVRFVLAPAAPRLRLLAMSDGRAWWLTRSAVALASVAAFGTAAIGLFAQLGMPPELTAMLQALLLLALTLVAIASLIVDAVRFRGGGHRGRRSALVAVGCLALMLCWLVTIAVGPRVGATILAAFLVPLLVRTGRRIAATLVHGMAETPGEGGRALAVAAERCVQALVVLFAAVLVGEAWGFRIATLAAADTPGVRLLRGLLLAVVIAAAADLAWQTLRAVIEVRLAGHVAGEDLLEAARRQARVRTLLPILRNVVFCAIVVMAGLSALSGLGVQIGPLLAGAGVVGIALGLGAQTIVRDVLAGIFYLLDDAFRVGEYIESGNSKGKVEGFSLRSVRLRHYLGHLQTVPFGYLREITNFSRDWMSEEMSLTLALDADVVAAEAAVAEVAAAMAADATIGPDILEPLASMGVSRITEQGVVLGLIVRTRPGQQFAARAAALRLLPPALAARGVRLARPWPEDGRMVIPTGLPRAAA